MKSKHIIAITALAFASFTSCTSVLDKDDLTVVSEKATWNSEILATAFLDKCYKDMDIFLQRKKEALSTQKEEASLFLYCVAPGIEAFVFSGVQWSL